MGIDPVSEIQVVINASYAVMVLERPVKTQFIKNPESDEQGYAHSGSESKDVSEREARGPHEVSPSDDEVILEHRRGIYENERRQPLCDDETLKIVLFRVRMQK